MSNDKRVERDGTDFPLTPKWDESMNFTKDDLSAAREALSAMLAEMADPAFCPDDGGCIFGWDHDDCLRELCMGCVRELATRAHAIEATLAQRDETVQSLRVQLAQRDAEVARLRRRYDETVRSLNVFNGALTNSNLMLRDQLAQRDEMLAKILDIAEKASNLGNKARTNEYEDGQQHIGDIILDIIEEGEKNG